MKKLKNLCLTALIACTLAQTSQAYGSQRFMNLARYATAAAARCSQTFQNVKQSKPVQWIAKNPSKTLCIVAVSVVADVIRNDSQIKSLSEN